MRSRSRRAVLPQSLKPLALKHANMTDIYQIKSRHRLIENLQNTVHEGLSWATSTRSGRNPSVVDNTANVRGKSELKVPFYKGWSKTWTLPKLYFFEDTVILHQIFGKESLAKEIKLQDFVPSIIAIVMNSGASLKFLESSVN